MSVSQLQLPSGDESTSRKPGRGPSAVATVLTAVSLVCAIIWILSPRRREQPRSMPEIRASLAENEQLGRTERLAADHLELGTLLLGQGKLDEAETHLRSSVDLAMQLGQDKAAADARLWIAQLLSRRGDVDRAKEQFLSALELYDKLGRTLQMALTNNSIGILEMNRMNKPAAREHFNRAMRLFVELGNETGLQQTRQLLTLLESLKPLPKAPAAATQTVPAQ